MSNTNPVPQNPFMKKIIHVFLGRGRKGSQKIIVVAPDHPEITEIECSVYTPPFGPVTQTAKFKDEIVRLYQFEFSGLTDGQTYSYNFTANGKSLELGGGLKDTDLYFQYWSELKESDSLIHMSCNGVFFYKEEDKKWDMWQRLLNELDTGALDPKLLVLGGDQYYQDEVEHDWFDKLDTVNFQNCKEEFKKASLVNALKHWEDLSYRKILSRIPSVAMLDDHDITDGANGNRNEIYEGETAEFNEKWKKFSGVQKELFSLLQASRNPTPSLEKTDHAFSFVLELGETALVALDLRTEKNARAKILQAENSKKALFDDIRRLSQKNVMILIPVVPLKNSQTVEKTTLGFAQLASQFIASKGQTELDKKLKKKAGVLAGLEDDITDALCSDSNQDYLFELLNLIMDGAAKGINYTILSGDIHTAGSVEVHLERKGQYVKLPILVSSPISYEPMFYLVESFLKEKKMIELKNGDINLRAVNHDFVTNRNFMEIYPARLRSNPNEAVFLTQEGVEGSKTVLVKAWNRDKSRAITKPTVILASQDASATVKPS